ncbi:Copia protein [Phytophthora megakarya]|uniref:Copia protein n=1 Tax=Phytophthora megakarya TaxID=4795 RepID=A0A225VS01_9STRA|nr:Copia protein [Phytophthora megakarya]
MRSRHSKKWKETMAEEYGRLVACGNEQEYEVNYGVTFAAVMDMTSIKLILVLARKWRIPAKHGEVPSAYIKTDKGAELAIFIHLPQGMEVSEETLSQLGVDANEVLALELKKVLYGLKQAGLLWNKLLHNKIMEIGFKQSLTDMCGYYRWRGDGPAGSRSVCRRLARHR